MNVGEIDSNWCK